MALSLLLHFMLISGVSVLKDAPEAPGRENTTYMVRIIEPSRQASRQPQPIPPVPTKDAVPDIIEDTVAGGPSGAGGAGARASVRQPEQPSGVPEETKLIPGREALFDPVIIDRQALEPLMDGSEERNGITFSTDQMVLTGYMGILRQKIESSWQYPHEALRKRIYGDAIIRFVIRRDGTLGSVRLLRTSGYSMLDQAAIKALRTAGPFWPLPDGYQSEALTITGRFIYTLSGWYIR